jgi:hypothetical protein
MKLFALVPFLLASALTVPALAQGENNPNVSTVIIEYVGRSDHPLPAIVLTRSLEEGNWYRSELFPGPVGAILTDIGVVQDSSMREILAILRSSNTLGKSSTVDAQRGLPRLDITYGDGRKYSREWMNAADSNTALEGLVKILSQQSEINVHLSEMKDRLVRYLKNKSATDMGGDRPLLVPASIRKFALLKQRQQ